MVPPVNDCPILVAGATTSSSCVDETNTGTTADAPTTSRDAVVAGKAGDKNDDAVVSSSPDQIISAETNPCSSNTANTIKDNSLDNKNGACENNLISACFENQNAFSDSEKLIVEAAVLQLKTGSINNKDNQVDGNNPRQNDTFEDTLKAQLLQFGGDEDVKQQETVKITEGEERQDMTPSNDVIERE